MSTGVLDIDQPVSLYHKVLAIQELTKVISDPKKAVQDDVVLTVLLLGVHEGMSMPGQDSNPFDSPLRTAQSLHIYGRVDKASPHMKPLKKTMDLRGGIESCTSFAFLWSIIVQDEVILQFQQRRRGANLIYLMLMSQSEMAQ